MRGDEVIVEGQTLQSALAVLAERLEGMDSISVTGVRRDGMWRVMGSIPLQRTRTTYESCGCLTNDEGAHRGDCPDFVTRVGVNGRYWTRRPCCGPWAGHGHDPTCEMVVR
jgi:hypothetical protein